MIRRISNCFCRNLHKSAMGLSRSGFTPAKKLPQYVATLSACIGSIVFGTILGWTAQISGDLLSGNVYDFEISEDELGWIGSSAALGALLSCIPSGYISDNIGRKKSMLLLTVPCMIGWPLITWADSVWMVIAGRFLTGVTGGSFTATIPLYINEIATKDVRGILGSYFQVMINVGILFDYVFGAILQPFYYNLICLFPLLLFCLVFVFQPESPVYLLMKNETDEARASLSKLRGITFDVNQELEEIQTSLEEKRQCRLKLKDALKRMEIRKSFIIASGLVFFFQFSGINAIIFYTSEIFNAANMDLKSETATIIVGVTMVLAMFVASFIMDKFGRKTLLVISDFVMGVCCFLLGMFFSMKERDWMDANSAEKISALPIISVCIFIVAFCFGFGPVTWIVGPEVTIPEMRGKVVSVAGTMNWLLTFFITKFFFDIKKTIGIDSLFYIFAVVSLVGTFWVFLYVVETKGKTVEQIQFEIKSGYSQKPLSRKQSYAVDNNAFVTD